jgi:hypothetical protein
MRGRGRWLPNIFAGSRGENTGIMRDSVALKRSTGASSSPEDVVRTFIKSVDSSKRTDQPYPHWILQGCFPSEVVDDMLALPFPPPPLDGISGKRELHNNTRKYFDVENRKLFPVCDAVARAFQDKRMTDHIEQVFDTDLADTYLRIEFAQDTDGFWLEPHTDLGVKKFTLLIYLSKDESQHNLGTDIYGPDKKYLGRPPFTSNAAMVFVPADNTYHGFEKRQIKGVRTSLIINYVTEEWRAREQLAFPEAPIA